MVELLLFISSVVFEPAIPLEQAYQGPGPYYWRVDFGTGDLVQSGINLEEEPEDWQAVYDQKCKKVAPWAERKGYTPPHDGCWIRHDCPPMLTHYADVPNVGIRNAIHFLTFLLL